MAPSRNTTDGIQAEMDDKRLLLHIGGRSSHLFCPSVRPKKGVTFYERSPWPTFSPLLCTDISYARGYVSQWENFHDQIEPIATRLPYMTVGQTGGLGPDC
jgi:hypothetical protein